jgi:hypothetical protein
VEETKLEESNKAIDIIKKIILEVLNFEMTGDQSMILENYETSRHQD